MPEPGFISTSRVAVLGLGLMGGSLALALRGRCAGLFGVDPDPETCSLARAMGAFEMVSTHPAEILPRADLVILAAPVSAILSLLRDLPALHPGSPVVFDLGSTKTQILAAMEQLPSRFDPLGGHPICGKETSGLQNAEAVLFQGAPFVLAPLSRSRERSRALALELVRTIGAHPFWLDPQTHDHWVAATSHLPYLLSNALAAATPLEVAPLIGPGFCSTSRLAASSPGMMRDVLATNRTEILAAVDRYREQLDRLEGSLRADDPSGLTDLLSQGASRRADLIAAQSRSVL